MTNFYYIEADFNRIHKGHIGTAPKSAFKRKTREHKSDWPSHVRAELAAWESTHRLWLRFAGPVLVVRYERLVRRTRRTLAAVLDFLNRTVTEEDMNCAITNKEGIYRRRKKYKDFDPFTPSMYAELESARRRVHDLVTDYQRAHNRTDNRNNRLCAPIKCII